ncbi:MAG: hypothetical protein IKQ71_00665 [Lachnospiraceae bacterium]|nr:hypothetical protein [Lachnospiraceae bacterium]
MRSTKSSSKKNENIYRVGIMLKLFIGIFVLLILLVVSLLFYDSFWGMVPLLPVGLYIEKIATRIIEDKRREKLSLEFREFLENISGSLYAGVSLENSFIRGYEALLTLFGEKSILVSELSKGVKKLKMNMPIERVLYGLAEATDNEEVKSFALLVGLAKRSGGNLIHIIRQAVGHISDGIKVREEIGVMIASKKLEQRIMCLMPFAILIYMKLTSPGFFDVLYHNTFGIVFMSVCLLIILAAYALGDRIMDIKI